VKGKAKEREKPHGHAFVRLRRKPEDTMTEQAWPSPSSSGDPQAWPTPSSGHPGAASPGAAAEPIERETPISREELRERRRRGFPQEPEVEYERSVIRIPFYLKRPEADEESHKVDVMAFDAFMRIIREAPTTNGIGYRQFEFYIDAWELTNSFSMGLGTDITFTLSDTVQPKSICIARQREADYPALIVYSAIYDVYLGQERIIEKQAGVAYASPVWEIPPRNVTVAFEKPFESEVMAFSAGTCEGMQSISREEFQRGVSMAQTTRSQ
jgi:hypothetical protein